MTSSTKSRRLMNTWVLTYSSLLWGVECRCTMVIVCTRPRFCLPPLACTAHRFSAVSLGHHQVRLSRGTKTQHNNTDTQTHRHTYTQTHRHSSVATAWILLVCSVFVCAALVCRNGTASSKQTGRGGRTASTRRPAGRVPAKERESPSGSAAAAAEPASWIAVCAEARTAAK